MAPRVGFQSFERLGTIGMMTSSSALPHIVLHGPESTGKSTLLLSLARHYDTIALPEFGRIWCETHGIDITRHDLLEIFKGHASMTRDSTINARNVLLSDTDPLMTQAWSIMLFNERMPEIDAWDDTGDLYVVPDIDIPWVDDGTRMFGAPDQRRRFMDVAVNELERRNVRWQLIQGDGVVRLASAIRAIDALLSEREEAAATRALA